MNKFISKIAVALVGCAMAVGVGVVASQRSDYKEARATYVVKTTPEASITSGKKYLIVSNLSYYATSWSSSKVLVSAVPTPQQGGVSAIQNVGNYAFTLTSTAADVYTILEDSSGKYIGYGTSGTGITKVDSVSNNQQKWTITGSDGLFTIVNVASTSRKWATNSATPSDIRAYSTLNTGASEYFYFYEIENITVEVTDVTITGNVPVTSGTKGLAQLQLTGTVSYSSTIGSNGLTWESDTPAVATVSNNGLVTFVDNGSATITATSTEDDNFSDSVLVNASNLEAAKGGSDNPFTPAEIKTFIDGAYDGTSTIYAKGIVSQKDDWDGGFNNANIFLTDTGNNDSANKIELFRFANKTKYDAISVGDYVVVSGVWVNYNGTGVYETTQGNSDIDTTTISKVSSISATATTSSFPRGTVVPASNFTVNSTYANGYAANGVTGFTFTVNGEAGAALQANDNAIVITYLGQTANLNITGTVTHATSVSVDETASVYVGLTTQLTATVLPAGQSDDIVWVSSVPGKASVDQNGLVTGVEAGETIITVFADADADGVKDDGEFFDTCTVTVNNRVPTALSITGKQTSFTSGDEFTVNGTIKVTFQDDSQNPVEIEETDANLTYYIGTQSEVNAKTADTISIGDALSAEHDGLYVKAYYGNIGATAYQISVLYPFDYSGGTFYKVTEAPQDWTGKYILVYETGKLAFHGADVTKSSTSIVIDASDRIVPVENLAVLDIAAMQGGGYSIQVKNGTMIGKYLGATSNANGMPANVDPVANSISLDASDNVDISASSAHLRFNTGNSEMRFRYYKSSSYTSMAAVQIYKYRSNADVVDEFIDDFMHMDDYDPELSTKGQPVVEPYGECETYYPLAKAAYNNLTAAQKTYLVDNSDQGEIYHDAFERLLAWAAANGESLNESTKILGAANNGGLQTIINDGNNSTIIAIVIISIASALAVGGYFFIRRRKER